MKRYNIEGNSSNDMLRKNYLVDQFYGSETLFGHYHMPGEGNIRAFVGRGERGAEALVSSTTELSLFKNIAKADQEAINLEFATFIDGGIFWDRDNVSISGSDRILNQEFEKRNLVDAGMGIRLKKGY